MYRQRRWAGFAILLFATSAGTLPLCASPPVDKPAVGPQAESARLLELGARYSPAALAQARAYYWRLGATSKNDVSVRYAVALVLIRQRCHKESIELLNALLAQQPDALHLWRAKIWAEMALHQESEALADIRSVANVLGKQHPAALPAADREVRRATAAFLGRVFGFLDVPRPDALPTNEVRRAKQRLLTALGEERAEFEQNEDAVAEKFSKARATFEDVRTKRVAAGTTKQNALGQQKKLIDEGEAKVDFDTEKMKTNTKTEVGRLDQTAQMVDKNIQACQFRLNDVRLAIQAIQIRLLKLSGDIPAGDADVGINLMSSNDRTVANIQLNKQLPPLFAEQTMLNQQLADLNRQAQATLTQREFAREKGEQTAEELKTQAATLKHAEKKLERAEQAEAKKVTAQREKTVLTKQTSFATFEPFPFDTEKRRVLGAVEH